MRRRDLLAALPAAALLPFALTAPATAQINRADLTRITNYLNGIGTMTGTFVQVGPDGDLSEGTFYMRRPGRIRFEYNLPNPTLIVADGYWVAVIDTQDRTIDRFPLSETPLDLLLRDRVDLRETSAVRSIERTPGQLRVKAIDPNAPDQGSITMIFSANPLELSQWIVIDAQGLATTVALSEVKRNVEIPPDKFRIEEPR